MRAVLLMTTCLALAFFVPEVPAQKMKSKPGQKQVLKGRLPNYYGQIDLSDEQRQKIYQIQADFKVRIASLQEQLEEIRTEQILEIQAVLSEDQKTEVNRLIAAARKRRESSR